MKNINDYPKDLLVREAYEGLMHIKEDLIDSAQISVRDGTADDFFERLFKILKAVKIDYKKLNGINVNNANNYSNVVINCINDLNKKYSDILKFLESNDPSEDYDLVGILGTKNIYFEI